MNLHKYQKNDIVFWLGGICFTGDNDHQNFLVFAPILTSLILDSHKNVTKWISAEILSKNIK